ncbi:MAG: hypothetical protein ABSE70_06115 [Candidatus Limnocylindrales bacterium]
MNRRHEFGLAIAVAALLFSGCTSAAATPSAGGPMTTPTGGATPTGQASAASPTPGATPRPAQWVSAGTMNVGRSATHAVKLSTGDVLVVGEDAACEGEGMYAGSKSVFAELYHPSSSTWTTTGSLNAPRAYFAAEPLTNGRAFVTAGVSGDSVSYSSTKVYDETAGTFTQTGPLNYARTSPAYALLNDGRILVAGGSYYSSLTDGVPLSSAEVFDPATSTWSMTGAMHQARDDFQAVTLTDGRVLAVGGGSNTVTTAELWDPKTGIWSNAGSLATWRFDFSLLALPDGSALVAGGEGEVAGGEGEVGVLTSAERFDPAALTWSSAGNMQTAAAGRMAAVLANGKVLFAGGWVSVRSYLTASEVYDPVSGSWTPTVPLPHMRADGQTVLLADGSVLIAGGDDDAWNGGAVGAGDCRRALPEALRYIPAVP